MMVEKTVGTELSFEGRVWRFGDWISGDSHVLQFSDMKDFAGSQDEAALAARCFAEVDPNFAREVKQGDILVAGKGFGLPSHPPVPIALRASGIAVVVVESTDTAFTRRCLNEALPVMTCPGILDLVAHAETLRVNLETGLVANVATGQTAQGSAFSPRMLDVYRAGGILKYLENKHGTH